MPGDYNEPKDRTKVKYMVEKLSITVMSQTTRSSQSPMKTEMEIIQTIKARMKSERIKTQRNGMKRMYKYLQKGKTNDIPLDRQSYIVNIFLKIYTFKLKLIRGNIAGWT